MFTTSQKTISWSDFKLANAKVHVWHALLEQPEAVIRALEAVLSDEERQRVEQFRFHKHRQAFLVGRGILRFLLSHYTGIAPGKIEFMYSLTGKPFLANQQLTSDIQFNLSHAGELALYAFAWGRRVGIDIEHIHPMDEMDQIAGQNFSTEENSRFMEISRADRLQAFYNCWTRKEAFLKATGDGLYFPMHDIEVSFEPDVPAGLLSIAGSRAHAKMWSMHDLKTSEGYAAALVAEGNDYSISHKQWSYTGHLLES